MIYKTIDEKVLKNRPLAMNQYTYIKFKSKITQNLSHELRNFSSKSIKL